ncbi:hypothetical protein DFS34DRAFT_72688 [Phlyctochytrium arcticum]|nr:hypothetical protein DFS34DRAFT_72688 [Phlyctochytrium arcticum]
MEPNPWTDTSGTANDTVLAQDPSRTIPRSSPHIVRYEGAAAIIDLAARSFRMFCIGSLKNVLADDAAHELEYRSAFWDRVLESIFCFPWLSWTSGEVENRLMSRSRAAQNNADTAPAMKHDGIGTLLLCDMRVLSLRTKWQLDSPHPPRAAFNDLLRNSGHLQVDMLRARPVVFALLQILRRFHSAFSYEGNIIGNYTTLPYHPTFIKPPPPPRCPRSISPADRAILDNERDTMLSLGRWRKTYNFVAASDPVPIHYVDKPTRIAFDFRAVNECMAWDPWTSSHGWSRSRSASSPAATPTKAFIKLPSIPTLAPGSASASPTASTNLSSCPSDQ